MSRAAVIITTALLITGNLVGAGILALPINTGLAGFFPSLIGMLVMGLAMLFSALVLSKEAIDEKADTFNYPSLYHKYLGNVGKWIAIFANLLILYGLLTAYLTGGASIITNLFHTSLSNKVIQIILFLLITFFTLAKSSFFRKYNSLLILLLWISFMYIVFISESYVDVARLKYTDWSFLPATVPIILTSFHFHNLIPNVCKHLDWNYKHIWKTILIGMSIGYLMNAIWIQVGIGSLPLAGSKLSILSAFKNNIPATVPLSQMISSSTFIIGSLFFALLAIITSYLANGKALLGFIEDLTKNHLNLHSRFAEIAITFLPPLIISLIYPDIFLKALNIVGGVGIVLLFGILPSIIGIKKFKSKKLKFLSVIMLILFASFFIIEICQEIGLLQIKPHVEHWTTLTH